MPEFIPRRPDLTTTLPIELGIWLNEDGSLSFSARIPEKNKRFRIVKKKPTEIRDWGLMPKKLKIEGAGGNEKREGD